MRHLLRATRLLGRRGRVGRPPNQRFDSLGDAPSQTTSSALLAHQMDTYTPATTSVAAIHDSNSSFGADRRSNPLSALERTSEGESNSTTERKNNQLRVMHAGPLSPKDSFSTIPLRIRVPFSRRTPASPIRTTANNGAAENCSGAAARVTLAAPCRPAAQPARHAPPQSLSLSR